MERGRARLLRGDVLVGRQGAYAEERAGCGRVGRLHFEREGAVAGLEREEERVPDVEGGEAVEATDVEPRDPLGVVAAVGAGRW